MLTPKDAGTSIAVHASNSADSSSSEAVQTSPTSPTSDNTVPEETSPLEAFELASSSVIVNFCAPTPCQASGEESCPSPESSTECSLCSKCTKLNVKNRRLQKQVSKLKARNRELTKARRAILDVSSIFLCQCLKFYDECNL